jgi:hypothetical protein
VLWLSGAVLVSPKASHATGALPAWGRPCSNSAALCGAAVPVTAAAATVSARSSAAAGAAAGAPAGAAAEVTRLAAVDWRALRMQGPCDGRRGLCLQRIDMPIRAERGLDMRFPCASSASCASTGGSMRLRGTGAPWTPLTVAGGSPLAGGAEGQAGRGALGTRFLAEPLRSELQQRAYTVAAQLDPESQAQVSGPPCSAVL